MSPGRPLRRVICPGCGRSVYVTSRDTYGEHTITDRGALADVDCDWSGSALESADDPWDDGDSWDEGYLG